MARRHDSMFRDQRLNVAKLQQRQVHDTLHDSGDNR